MPGALATTAISTAAAEDIPVGNLADYTGPTSTVSKVHNQGVIDAMDYINAHGGINGKKLKYDTVDYSYQAPRAIAAYKRWKSQLGVVAIQGWGTADTEALVSFVAKDHIPYYSGSYSGHLTDPTGKSPETKKPAPYNFFYGPSYSDGVRAMIQWAAEDWKKSGKEGKPKYVHMGDNHPYPNAAKKAGEEYAKEMGFEVLPSIQYSLAPGDFKAQCLTLKESGANYAYLANTAGSTISLLKACHTVGVNVQFMANVWGFDENAMDAAGEAGDGVVWVVGAQPWTSDAPGMKLVREISKMSDPSGTQYRRRPLHPWHLLGVLHEGSHGVGRRERRHHGREHQEGHVPEEGLGARGPGRCLPAVDLDRRGPSRRADGLHLPGALQWRRLEDGRALPGQAAAQAGVAGLVMPSHA